MTTTNINEELLAPLEYWYARPDQIADIVNGCGSRSSHLIPDKLLGLDITKACDIHDWMYTFDRNDRAKSDKVFFKNLLILNKHHSRNKFVEFFRKPLLALYYLGVRAFGSIHFKQVPEVELISNIVTH